MRNKLLLHSSVLFSFLMAVLITEGCQKKEEAAPPEGSIQAETTQHVQQEEEVLKALDKKETKLKEDINALFAEIDKKEQELIQRENSLRTYRNLSYVIFIVGLVLFLVGLGMISVARGKRPSAKERKAKKKNAKSAKKAGKGEEAKEA